MPQKSRWSVDIPIISFPSLVLGSPDAQLSDQPCYLDAEEPDALSVTRAEFALWARRVAAGLIQAGLRPNERVLVYSGNNIFYPIVFMGVIMAGGIVTTANPAFVARELAYQLQDSGTKFLLVAEGSLTAALDAAKMIKFKTQNMFIFDDLPLWSPGRARDKGAVRHWSCLIAVPEVGAAFRWEDGKTQDFIRRTVAILYSSGTTGIPKGVELSHYSLTANIRQLDFLFNLDPRFKADENNSLNQRMFCPLPMYHSLGLLFYSTLALYRHIPVYILKKYSLTGMLKAIQDHRITELTLVPPMVVAMAKSPESREYDLSSVLKIQAGAAPMSRDTCAEFEKLWPHGQVNVKQAWGMTETPTTVLHWDERDISTTQAAGEPVPNCEVKLMADDEIHEVPFGQRGELWVRAPQAMKGYWNNPEATRDIFTADGWLKTGDIASQDKEGRYWIVDRKKELIKVKGNQVAPAELEALLLEHPDIQEGAVIGVKQGEDERPYAYVALKPGSRLSTNDVLAFVKARTSRIKWLYGAEFIASIPKNPSGKILRRQLRDFAASQKIGHIIASDMRAIPKL